MMPWFPSPPSPLSPLAGCQPRLFKGLPPYQLPLGRRNAFPLFIKAKNQKGGEKT